jgi:hypothetical protein
VFDGAQYLYDVSTTLSIPWRPCWCWQCNDVCLGEFLPTPNEIVEEAKAWRRRDQEFNYVTEFRPPTGFRDDEHEPYALAYFDDLFAWRITRVSPPKCLSCGSENILVTKSRFSDMFEHPDCGGMISTRFSVFGGTSRNVSPTHWYTSEGVFLRTEVDHQ